MSQPSLPPLPLCSVTQDIQHAAVGARVSQEVSQGVFSNALLIVQSQDIFAIDFLSTVTQPQQIVIRAILPAAAFSELISALQVNITAYERRFGPLACPSGSPTTPQPDIAASGDSAPSPGTSASPSCPSGEPSLPHIDELYDRLKLPDKVAGGVFSNVVLICHTAHEFALDFVCNLFPRAVVNARVFVPASRMRQFADTVASSWAQYRQRTGPRNREESDGSGLP